MMRHQKQNNHKGLDLSNEMGFFFKCSKHFQDSSHQICLYLFTIDMWKNPNVFSICNWATFVRLDWFHNQIGLTWREDLLDVQIYWMPLCLIEKKELTWFPFIPFTLFFLYNLQLSYVNNRFFFSVVQKKIQGIII